MNLEIQLQFAASYHDLMTGKYNKGTIANIVQTLIDNYHAISDDAKSKILDIPLHYLKCYAVMPEHVEKNWAVRNAHEFAGYAIHDGAFCEQFAQGVFGRNTIIKYLSYIMDNVKNLDATAKLKIIKDAVLEATEDRTFTDFGKSGLIFARHLESAFDL